MEYAVKFNRGDESSQMHYSNPIIQLAVCHGMPSMKYSVPNTSGAPPIDPIAIIPPLLYMFSCAWMIGSLIRLLLKSSYAISLYTHQGLVKYGHQ